MWKVSIKNIWARKFRILSLLSIIVSGVGFMAGTLILTDTIGKTFDNLFADVYRNADAVVRGKAEYETDNQGTVRLRLPADLLAQTKSAPGVADAVGFLSTTAQAIDRKGKAIGGGGPPTFGYNWTGGGLNPYDLVKGAAPQSDTDVVIDNLIAGKGPYTVGDKIPVADSAGLETFTVSGVARFGTADSAGGATGLLFTLPTLQRLAGDADHYEEIVASATAGVSQTTLRDSIAKTLGAGNAEVVTATARSNESASDIKKALSFFNTFLLVFAAIAIFVGMFVIFNTFSILIAQRTREMALMRAIGASRAQLRRSVVLEAGIIGAIGSAIGIGFGLVMAAILKGVFKSFGADIPAEGLVITARTIVVGFGVGTVTTVCAAYLPARKAARVPPVAAMRDVAIDRAASSTSRLAVGLLLLAAAAGALIGGLVSFGISFVGLAFLLAIFSVATLGPVIARPLSRLIGSPLPRLRGMTGTLARENASRNPRRTSATALALTIGVALVSGILVMASSLKTSLNSTIDKQFTGDYVVTGKAAGGGPTSGFSTGVATALGRVEGVANATSYRQAQAKIDGSVATVVAVDPTSLSTSISVGNVTGTFAQLDNASIAVSQKYADSKHLGVGSTVSVTFPRQTTTLTVVAVYEKADIVGARVIGLTTYDAGYNDRNDAAVFVKLAKGADATKTKAALDSVVATFPTVELQDRTQFKKQQAAQINGLLALIYVLLALAIVIALAGIANTLSLSIHERRRELGLLRAVGQMRSQTRASVRWESAIIATFGALLGLTVGVGFGIAIVKALSKDGLNTLAIPIGGLVIITAVAALFGVIASLNPARRGAKLDILQAIATE